MAFTTSIASDCMGKSLELQVTEQLGLTREPVSRLE